MEPFGGKSLAPASSPSTLLPRHLSFCIMKATLGLVALTNAYIYSRALPLVAQFLVTRTMEDFVTWVDGSKIKRAIKTYEDKLDDFDLLGEG